jgi:beta-lactam-binding protein with PASTA domain
MRSFFNILLGGLAMIAVALLSAFITMRLVIHGREVEVPNVAGLTVAEASSLALRLGLNVNLENQFYSTVTPSGRVLSQSPAPGTKVRREWVLRITESIGPQKVSVPNVVGQTEREASVTIRRLALNLGTVAYIPAPGPTGIVLSQTPTPDAAGVDGPRVSLLVSEPLPVVRPRPAVGSSGGDTSGDASRNDVSSSSGDPNEFATRITDAGVQTPAGSFNIASGAGTGSPPAAAAGAAIGTALRSSGNNIGAQAESAVPAYVMPDLIGLSLSAASARVAAMGLRITSVESVPNRIRSIAPIGSISPPSATHNGQPAPIRPIAPVGPITLSDTVVAQSPTPGHRVTKNDAIHITLSH